MDSCAGAYPRVGCHQIFINFLSQLNQKTLKETPSIGLSINKALKSSITTILLSKYLYKSI